MPLERVDKLDHMADDWEATDSSDEFEGELYNEDINLDDDDMVSKTYLDLFIPSLSLY